MCDETIPLTFTLFDIARLLIVNPSHRVLAIRADEKPVILNLARLLKRNWERDERGGDVTERNGEKGMRWSRRQLGEQVLFWFEKAVSR